MGESYYECPICNKHTKTEKSARDHYNTHFGGPTSPSKAITPSRGGRGGSGPVEPLRYHSNLANAIDRGARKVKRGLDTVGEVQDAINSNFNFDAAFESFGGSSDFDFGVSLTGGILGNDEPPRRRKK